MAGETTQDLKDALDRLARDKTGNSSGDVKNTSNSPGALQTASTVPTNPNTSTGQGSDTSIDTKPVKGALDRFVAIINQATDGLDAAVKKLTGFGFSDVGNAAAGTASLKSIDDPSKTFNVAVNQFSKIFTKLSLIHI